MEAVAQADDNPWIVDGDHLGKPRQRRRRVVGRDELLPPGEGRALFQMQVGYGEQVERGEIKRAAAVAKRGLALDLYRLA